MDQESVKVVSEKMGISCPIPNMEFYILIETSGSNNAHDEEKLNDFLTICMNEGIIVDGITTSEPSKMKVGTLRECGNVALNWNEFKKRKNFEGRMFFSTVCVFEKRPSYSRRYYGLLEKI